MSEPRTRAEARCVSRGGTGLLTSRRALVAGLGLTAVELAAPVDPVLVVLSLALPALTAAALFTGIRRHRPACVLPWRLLAVAAVLWLVTNVVWDVQFAVQGRAPEPGSWNDPFAFTLYALLVAALVLFVRAREPDRPNLTDQYALAAAIGLVTWVMLVDPLLASGELTVTVRAVQTAYLMLDVLILSATLRLAFGAGERTRSFRLLVAGMLAFFASECAFNWLTISGLEVPERFASLGWFAAGTLIAVAALDPGMRDVAVRARSAPDPNLTLRAAAPLVAPAALALGPFFRGRFDVVPFTVGTTVLCGLVLWRMVGLVREAERLTLELAGQNTRLRRLDRAKDEFLAAVSHELRTPLTTIMGYSELLRGGSRGTLTPAQEECFDLIEEAGRRLLRQVSDLLSVARIEAQGIEPSLAPLETGRLLERALDAVRPAAQEKGVVLQLGETAAAPVAADATLLAQALDNLVSNALKFTPAGGLVQVGSRRENGHLLIEVRDDGVGIAEAEQEHLFDRFFRASNVHAGAVPGTGLGLYLVNKIVAAHGGRVGVASVEGEGTTVTIELPLRAAA